MSSIYIPTSGTSSSATKDYIDQIVQPLAVQLGTATSSNTVSTIVKRDGSGGFSAGVITTSGLESLGVNSTLSIASANNTNTVDIGKGTGVQTINVGNNGTGATTINIGGGSDVVKVNLPLKNSAGDDIFVMKGINNLLIGKTVMPAVTTGRDNAFLGTNIATTSTTGSYNTCVGTDSMTALTSGVGNVCVGLKSQFSSTSGSTNVTVGNSSLFSLTTGTDNIAIGEKAGYDSGNASRCHITGNQCCFIGTSARPASQNLTNATAIGNTAIVDADNTIQLGNTLVTQVRTTGTVYAAGLELIGTTLTIAGQNNTSVIDIGKGTGVQTINMGNNGAGATTINLGGGSDVVAIPGVVTNGTKNMIQCNDIITRFGTNTASTGPTGNRNTAIGVSASNSLTSGSSNTSVGQDAGNKITTAAENVSIGYVAGAAIITGGRNTCLGTGADVMTSAQTNSIAIGYAAFAPASNTVKLGNDSITNVYTSGVLNAAGLESIGTISAAAPTTGSHLTTKAYVDNKFTTLPNQNLKTTDVVTFGGLKLPTTGGTAGTLDYYEEYSAQMKFNNTVVETPLLNYQIVRIGKQVTFTIKEGVLMQSSATGEFITMITNLIPSRFLPTHTIPFPIIIIQNNTRLVGKVVIDMSDSKLHILGAGNVYFTNGMTNGFDPFSITYLI